MSPSAYRRQNAVAPSRSVQTWGRRRAYAGALVAIVALTVGTQASAAAAADSAAMSTASGRDVGAQRLAKQMSARDVSGWTLAPDTGFLFSAHVEAVGGQDNAGAVAAFEAKLGRKLDAHWVFARWDDPLSSGIVAGDITRGRIPILSIRPQRKDGSTLSWGSIAAGTHDANIRSQADAIAALSAPIILTLHHEPDQINHGTAAEFVAAWRHYVSIFRARGVTNVAWNWIMTPSSFRTPPIGPGANALYPGDDVVDWISLDPYNWYGCMPNGPTAWRPLREMVTPFAAWAEPHGKPLMLAEWASAEDPARATRKAEWFAEAAVTLQEFAKIKAVSYYEGVGKCPWWSGSSASSQLAFGDLASGVRAHGRTMAMLTPSTNLGPTPLSVTFDTSRSTGQGHVTGTGVTHWHLDFGDGSTPADGTGPLPSNWVHTYAAGSYLAQLTVSDALGGANTDARGIKVAGKPIITASETDISDTAAQLHTWVNPQGLAAQVTVEWRKGEVYTEHQDFDLPPGGTKQLDVTAGALDPGTRIFWRVRATSAAGTTVTPERSFSTWGPPEATTQAPGDVTSTSAVLYAVVAPHALPTEYWFEWWRTSPDHQVTSRGVVPQSSSSWVSKTLTGLTPGTVYRYRAVAQNSAGTAYGAEMQFTSRP